MSQKEIASIITLIKIQIEILKKSYDVTDKLIVEKRSDSQYEYHIIKNDGEDMAIFNYHGQNADHDVNKEIREAIYELYSMDVFKADALKKFLEM